MDVQKSIDSKFRFVILASKRAKELLRGAKPRVKSKSKNPILIAQEEARLGLIGYEITAPNKGEIHELLDEGFIGEEIGPEGEDEDEGIEEEIEEQQRKLEEEGEEEETLEEEPSNEDSENSEEEES